MGTKRPIVVAVDGPAGSGKSSVCAEACRLLGWTYVNTGFLYRAVGVVARKKGVEMRNVEDLAEVASYLAEALTWNPTTKRVLVEGEDVTPALSSVQAGADASFVATLPVVRERLLPVQRKLALQAEKGTIVDGRDIGTVVFPDADLKVFLTASLEKRAERRYMQLRSLGNEADFDLIRTDIASRDHQDGNRATAPLKQASDAVLLDTSNLGIQETIEALVELVREKLGHKLGN